MEHFEDFSSIWKNIGDSNKKSVLELKHEIETGLIVLK